MLNNKNCALNCPPAAAPLGDELESVATLKSGVVEAGLDSVLPPVSELLVEVLDVTEVECDVDDSEDEDDVDDDSEDDDDVDDEVRLVLL